MASCVKASQCLVWPALVGPHQEPPLGPGNVAWEMSVALSVYVCMYADINKAIVED